MKRTVDRGTVLIDCELNNEGRGERGGANT